MFSVNLVHTELCALARVGLYKVCNDCSCPTCVEVSQLETPSPSTDVFFHIFLVWVSANLLHLWAFRGNCSFSFLVTWKVFVDQRPLIIQIGTSFSLQILPQPSLFLFHSVTVRFPGYDRKYKPDYQMTHPVVSPLELLQFHLCSQARNWGSSRGAKWSSYHLGKPCCRCHVLALQSTST